MSRTAIDFWFYFTLFGGLPLGIILATIWAKRVLPRLFKRVNKQVEQHGVISISGISMQSLVYMAPAFILLIACCVPATVHDYFSRAATAARKMPKTASDTRLKSLANP